MVLVVLATCAVSLVACESSGSAKYMIPYIGPVLAINDQVSNEQKMKLSQKMMKDPDLQEWREAREKISMAEGDRVFEGSVDSIYKAIITAVSSMEVDVESAEKDSGFIAGQGKVLPPDRASQLRKERMVEYAKANGMSPKSADPGPFFDPDTMAAVMESQTGLTITVGEHGQGKTKVKARFSKIYYPPELQECYALLWQSIDKQGFLNKALDAPESK
jgi:hypothetical protein